MSRAVRTGLAGLTGIVVLTVAGCTGGSDGTTSDPSTSASSSAASSSPATTGAPTTGSTVPSATNAPTSPSGTGTVSGPGIPATPEVPSGSAGAYSIVVTGGGAVTTAVPTVTCAQDGSLTAGGLQLAPGGTSLRFVDVAPVGTLDVPGSAEITAEGGVFRGTTSTTAVAFSWTC